MILRSILLMTIIDVITIGLGVLALWIFYHHRQLLKQLGVFKTLSLIILRVDSIKVTEVLAPTLTARPTISSSISTHG